MTLNALSVWLIAVGGVTTAVGFFGNPPDGGGMRFWNPLSRRARLLWSGAAAGTVLLTAGGLFALFGDDTHSVNRPIVVAVTAVVLLVLTYGFDVHRLLRDRKTALQQHARLPELPMHETAKPMATLRWSLRHPLHDGLWERPDKTDQAAG